MILKAIKDFAFGSQYDGWGTSIKEGEIFECTNQNQINTVIKLGFAKEHREDKGDSIN